MSPSGIRWRRLRERSPWLFVMAVLLAGAGAVLGKVGGPAWAMACGAAGLAIAGVVLLELHTREKKSDDQATVAGRAMCGIGLSGQIPRVWEMSLAQLGVHRMIIEIDYLQRDKEVDLAKLIAAGTPVVVLGHSMAGKSRMAAEVIYRRYRNSPIIVPEKANALADLIAAGGLPDEAIIWLNELDEYLTPDGLTTGILDQLLAGGNKVVATMRAAVFPQFQPSDQLRSVGADVLERFEHLWLDRTLTASEKARLPHHVAGELRESIERYGVAEYIGGGPWAVNKYQAGVTQHPVGAALVQAAADWRRAGMTGDVGLEILVKLVPHYLPKHRVAELESSDAVDKALEWAGERGNETVALLEKYPDGWRAFDFLVDHLTEKAESIPDPLWQMIIEHAIPETAAAPADAAFLVHGRADIAEALNKLAARSGDARAVNNLAVVLKEKGEVDEAEKLYRLAASVGHASSMFNLAVLLKEKGEVDEAEKWLRQAADAGQTRAMSNWAVALEERGAMAEAEGWLRRAADAGLASAMFNLGVLLQKRDEVIEAEAWYRWAIAAGQTDALNNLGVLLVGQGAEAEAEVCYRQAIRAGQADAMSNLGALLYKRGEESGAELWFRRAAEAGHSGALAKLRILLEAKGKTSEAEEWQKRAVTADERADESRP